MRIKNIFFSVLLSLFAVSGIAQIDTLQKTTASVKEKKEKSSSEETDKPPVLGDVFKPTIGLGAGTLSYFGNTYSTKHLQPITQSRFGYELNLSQPVAKGLFLNFYVMFGKLGANERSTVPALNKNFESQIRLGGLQMMYDFSHFIKKQSHIRPYVLAGFEGFEFLSKTDLYDKHGNKYYYWTDGSIKNMAQGSAGSQNATTLVRDYTYDTDVRESNQNGYGKYQEHSFAIPVGVGFTANMGEHIKFRMGTTMHFTFTNYIDGVGSSKKDKFMMLSASVHYDLYTRKKDGMDTLPADYFKDVDFLALDNGDEDGDGVKDFDDMCHGTPAGAKVDAKGCPVDEDKDLIGDYKDEELPTPDSLLANGKGVGITAAMSQKWYDDYYDSTGINAKVVNLDTAQENKTLNPFRGGKKEYTVELARYKGGIPNDEMAYLLSIGDVKSFNVGDTTVVYSAGSYEDVRTAVQRRDEFRSEGLKSARVGYFKGENYFSMTDAELQDDVTLADKNTTSSNTNSSTNNVSGQTIYRIQLGAYKNKLSPSVFKNAGKVLELKTEDGYFRYASGSYKTLQDAASHKAELVFEGYEDAFITAYRGGKRVPLLEAGATYENKDYKENLSETANSVSIIDKNLVSFKIQLGSLKKSDDTSYEDQIKDLKDVVKQPTTSGLIRLTVGDFKNYNDAVKYKKTLSDQGITDAFVIATFKGDVISIQEALELVK